MNDYIFASLANGTLLRIVSITKFLLKNLIFLDRGEEIVTAKKVHFIVSAFIEEVSTRGFTRDTAWQDSSLTPITGFYRDTNGVNQKIWLARRNSKDMWEAGAYLDVIGLHNFKHLEITVPQGAGQNILHFYDKNTSYFHRGVAEARATSDFLLILDEELLSPLDQFDSSEALASIFPSNIDIASISGGRRAREYGYRYWPTVKCCFMRIS